MPARWRLPKSRVSHDDQPGKTETIKTPEWDDFCFNDEAIPPIRDTHVEERPKTSSGVSEREKSKSKTKPQIGLSFIRPQTSEGRPPSTNYAGYSPSKLEGGMIGVAFGSPTHPPATFFGTLNDLAPPSTYEESLFEQTEPMYQIKGTTSKWKKLGSLFKGGKATAEKDDTFEVPFYKVRIEDDSEPKIEIRGRRPTNEAVELSARRSPTPPPKDTHRRSIDARLAKARLEVARLEEAIAVATKKSAKYEEEVTKDPLRPKLDLLIPDIKMDRYSVMFAGLKEIPPHSKLLARRSKKLDRLKPVSMENMKQLEEMPTPDTSTLSPRLVLPRRATSPLATKTTGGFSLFPAAALTPNHLTRQTLATPSPQPQLKRSATSPARLSPRADMFGANKSKTLDAPRVGSGNTLISPGDTTASTDQGAPWSAEAPLSPASTVTTIDEDILLSPARIDKSNEHEQRYPDVHEAQHMQFLASPTLPRETGSTPEATTPSTTVDPSQDDYKVRRVASSVFDAAIAEIEAFGVPSLQEQPSLPSPPSAYVPFVLASDEKLSTVTERPPPAILKSRFMMMNMPSPITEAPEESPAPSPANPRSVAVKAMPEIRALPQISEPQRRAPPAPIKLEKPPTRKTTGTSGGRATPTGSSSSITEVIKANPSSSPEKARIRASSLQRGQTHEEKQRQKHEQKLLAVQTSPPKRKVGSHSSLSEPTQEFQTSPPRTTGRSNSRQRTSDKAARVLGEVLPAPSHQMASLIGGRTASPATFGSEAPSTFRSETPPTFQLETPPAVPIKDSKFVLPLSRFAVKGTAAEVAHKTGLQASPRLAPPAKPVRSATEPLTTEHMNNPYPRSKPSRLARSASDESLRRDVTNPQAKDAATSNLQRMGMGRPNVVTVMAVVNPAPVVVGGEVGVARTVSLSRKPSQKILVRRGPEGNSPVIGREASLEDRAKKIQLRNEHQIAGSALRPPRSSSRPNNGPVSKLKRSESFKRAIEVGIEDEEEGDMRSGAARARALSPDVREVMTGLVVNGHKVMKSSAGIIEEA